MVEGLLKRAALLCAAIFLLAGAPASASGVFAPGSICVTPDPGHRGASALESDPDRWSCDPHRWSIVPDRVIMRFDLTDRDPAASPVFETRLTRFERLRLTTVDMRGVRASRVLVQDDMERASGDWLMTTPLPQNGASPQVLWIEIEQSRHLGMLTNARVFDAEGVATSPGIAELLLAGLCGLLVVPFVYNLAFYRVLRERFLLWHAAAVFFMFAHTIVSSGLINRFASPSVMELSLLSAISWSGGIVAAGMFIVNLVEPDKIDPWHSRVARTLSLWVVGCTVYYLFADGPLRATATPVYYAAFLPILGFFGLVMVTALRRGSRAIRFQIIAWMPIMVVGLTRVITSIGVFGTPLELMIEQHLAIAIEVVITSIGVADRFLIIKRQRDRALAETRSLEHEVERDALTGLLNRRAVGARFERLFAAGFDTMAVIDLDHFKRINDMHGHATGDEVLRCAAAALMSDESTLAVRMGGEEFLLLLRGSNAVLHAEHRRRAITARVAAIVPGLEFPVTASMGLVSQPRGSRVQPDFAALYAHCDRLLYEAKRAGRNRTMSERMTRFGGGASSKIAAA